MTAAAAADADWGSRLRSDPEATARFLQFLIRAELAPVRRGSLLEEFHELGLITALVPEMEAITGRVYHDAYHVLTVDA